MKIGTDQTDVITKVNIWASHGAQFAIHIEIPWSLSIPRVVPKMKRRCGPGTAAIKSCSCSTKLSIKVNMLLNVKMKFRPQLS